MKLDAPTIAAIGGLISTWLGMILGYLAHRNSLAAKAAAAPPPPAAPAPVLEPLPAVPAAAAPAYNRAHGYGGQQ